MGCCSSSKRHFRERLDDIEERVHEHVGRRDDGVLVALATCAKDMRQVFEDLRSTGAADTSSIHRIERLSDEVLGNLEHRISKDFLRRSDFSKKFEEMMAIARDLDSVRSAKASAYLEEAVSKCRTAMLASDEASARKPVVLLRQTLASMSSAEQLLAQAAGALDIVDEAHRQAPESKKVTDLLLKGIVELASKVIVFQAGWLVSPESIESIRAFATCIDEQAEQLVKIMGATWDPPMVPEVERLVEAHVSAVTAECAERADKALLERHCGGAFDLLEALKPFWPEAKKAESLVLQVLDLFSRIETLALEDFIGAVSSNERQQAIDIQEFATKCQALREDGFRGLPPSPNGDLPTFLKLGGRMSTIEKQLEVVEAELAKPADDDAAIKERLAAMIQALGTAATLWGPVAEKAAEELGERAVRACSAVEVWAERKADDYASGKVDADMPLSNEVPTDSTRSATGGMQGGKIASLLRFAAAYDGLRPKLEQVPGSEAAPLKQRISLRALALNLDFVEDEIGKGVAARAEMTLDVLRTAAGFVPVGAPGDKLRPRAAAAVEGLAGCIRDSFGEALKSNATRKQAKLLEIAERFDASTLRRRLHSSDAAAEGSPGAEGSIAGGDTEAGAGAGAEEGSCAASPQRGGPEAVISLKDELLDIQDAEALQFLGDLQERAGSGDIVEAVRRVAMVGRFSQRLVAVPRLRGPLAEALQVLAIRADGASVEVRERGTGSASELLDAALDADTALAALPAELPKVDPPFRGRLVGPCLEGSLEALQLIANGSEPMVREVVRKELASIKKCVDSGDACPKELKDNAKAFIKGPLKEVLLAALLAEEGSGVEVVAVARAADEVFGPDDGGSLGLGVELEGLRMAAERAQQVNEEAMREKMDPRRVINALNTLQTMWATASGYEPFRVYVVGIFEETDKRLQQACVKAVKSEHEVDKKVKTLCSIAGEVMKAQMRLLDLSKEPFQTRDFKSAICKVVVITGLEQVEAELAKDKGLVPDFVLNGLRDASTIWIGVPHDDEEVKERLSEALTQVRIRTLSAYKAALDEENSKKAKQLMSFADEFDKVCANFGEAYEEGGSMSTGLRKASQGMASMKE